MYKFDYSSVTLILLERPFAEVTVALPKVADDVEVVPS